jgi:hypothetical protein
MDKTTNGEDVKSSDENNDDNSNGEEEDSTITMSSKKNYYKAVNQKSKVRRDMKKWHPMGKKHRLWQ